MTGVVAPVPDRPGRDVLLTFATLSWQKGSASQVISLVNELRKVRPDTRFSLLSHCPELDDPPAAPLGIAVIGPRFSSHATPRRRSVHLLSKRLQCAFSGALGRNAPRRSPADRVARAYQEADLVVDLSGDSYRDPPGGFALAHHANLLAALANGTPYALVSQSVGPFRRFNARLARYLFNRAQFLYIRERRTREILLRLGVLPDRIEVAPDLAFLLPTSSSTPIWTAERIDPERIRRPWVGLSLSSLAMRVIRKHGNDYTEAMASLCHHLHRRYDASVFLIPHEVKPPAYGIDDRSVARALSHQMGRPNWMHVLSGDYEPSSLKGFISQCDALVASRLHAAIAGVSSGVPTLTVAWSHKYKGVMEEIGLAQYVWDQRTDACSDLLRLFDRLWRSRHAIRMHLLGYTATARRQVGRAVDRIARSIQAGSSASIGVT